MTVYHEAALIRAGKYVKRIDVGFTDAEPTVGSIVCSIVRPRVSNH